MMNLLLHDIACAIERDATHTSSERPDRDDCDRTAWAAEWHVRVQLELDDPRSAQPLPGVTR